MDYAIVDHYGEILDYAFGLADEDQVEMWAATEAYAWGYPAPRLVQLGERSGICIGATVDVLVHHRRAKHGLDGLAYRCDDSSPNVDRPIVIRGGSWSSTDTKMAQAGAGVG